MFTAMELTSMILMLIFCVITSMPCVVCIVLCVKVFNKISNEKESSITPVYLLHLLSYYNDVILGAIASQITSLTIVYSMVYSGADQRKHQSSASLAFVRGIHRGPVNSPQKWPVPRYMFPFDDVIMPPPYAPIFLLQCWWLTHKYVQRVTVTLTCWYYLCCRDFILTKTATIARHGRITSKLGVTSKLPCQFIEAWWRI